MVSALRIALFVEGATTPLPVRGVRPLAQIWNEHLCGALGIRAFHLIEPISKKHLVAMDPTQPKMSGASESLDELIARKLKTIKFDAVVVAWDLVPAWNPADKFCRWQETLDLYRFLANSPSVDLPDIWKQRASDRFNELQSRTTAASRNRLPQLKPGVVLALCMEPMFETALVQDEQALRGVLGLKQLPKDWPIAAWSGASNEPCPDTKILVPTINAVRNVRPRLKCVKQVPGDFRTNKDGWGEYLLKRLLANPKAQLQILSTNMIKRLSEIVPKQPSSR